jgi:hypothetical protein
VQRHKTSIKWQLNDLSLGLRIEHILYKAADVSRPFEMSGRIAFT